MKEIVLTPEELGSYAQTITCSLSNVNNHSYGCITVGESKAIAAMKYNSVSNVYNKSKVKEMLETRYLPTLGEVNLKEIDGYKIRLISLAELESNLGYTKRGTYQYNSSLENTPIWVYQNFGETLYGINTYWTMTPHPNYSNYVWYVNKAGWISSYGVNYPEMYYSVRPVINLLKSSIK